MERGKSHYISDEEKLLRDPRSKAKTSLRGHEAPCK